VPRLEATGDAAIGIHHPSVGELELLAGPSPDGARPTLLFCENETNLQRLYGTPGTTPYPKDGINDHVIAGAASVNPAGQGTKCAAWYRITVEPAATVELRLRLRPAGSGPDTAAALGPDFERVVAARRAEADEFYADLTPGSARGLRHRWRTRPGLPQPCVRQAAGQFHLVGQPGGR
jgi:hypothetical protein